MITEDPIFVGDKRTEGEPHHVTHFEIDNRPAVPASTIRGMISSLAEAASDSALRVLEDRHYSYRVGMRDGLGALGIIVEERGQDGRPVLKLRPLALPSLPWQNNQARIPREYSKIFTEPLLKVYVNSYRALGQAIEKTPGSFLQKRDPDSYCADKQEFWYMKLAGDFSLVNGVIKCIKPYSKQEYIKQIRTRRGGVLEFLNGQRAVGSPITEEKYNGLLEEEKKEYTRGILRVLGIEGREKDIPSTKTHEIFIPYPPKMEKYATFDVEEAVKDFENLAKERTQADKNLPFHPKGSRRNNSLDPKNANIKLRKYDIVFFQVSQSDPEKVGEVAISSIWRRSAGGSSYDYFRQISPELLPFNPERRVITIAEQLFGFVEHREKGEGNVEDSREEKESVLSFAGRLRFSFGILEGDEEEPYQPEVLLKILDSPKPPCPSLYFKPKNRPAGRFIAKKRLNPNDHIPQGRKFYLHRYSGATESWRTRYTEGEEANLKQKSYISPLKSGLTFCFHIDFDNLSRRELSLLCYALNPSDDYRHKIGMGKSIGLGRIRIVPEGLFIVDRMQRYREEDIFSSNRYHKSWIRDASNELPEAYIREKQTATFGGMSSPEVLRNEFADSMDKDIQKAIELIGSPENVKYPIHTPQLLGLNIEKETFSWFVENEEKEKYFLKPINKDSEELPTLGKGFQ